MEGAWGPGKEGLVKFRLKGLACKGATYMGIISLRRQVSLGHCFIKRSSGIWTKQRPREGTLASVGRLDLVKQTRGAEQYPV